MLLIMHSARKWKIWCKKRVGVHAFSKSNFSKFGKIRIDTRLSLPVDSQPVLEDMEIIEKSESRNLRLKMIDEIKNKGPMSIARFMHLCLSDSEFGYYTTKENIFNKGGDFTTSPEINQMFGEMIGVWFVSAMQKYQNLKHFNFVELGPGKGTLLCDILRTFSQTNVLSNMTFYLIEISDILKETQMENIMETLKKEKIYCSQDLQTQHLYETSRNLKFVWEKNLDKIKSEQAKKMKESLEKAKSNYLFLKRAVSNEEPFMILAHELFDALPVYQFVYDETLGWLERQIEIDQTNKDELVINTSSKPTKNVERLLQPEKRFASKEVQESLKSGDMIEISPHSQNTVTDIAELIAMTKGNALIIDYGEDQALTNSVRAIKNHKYLSENEMLRIPGKADISAYVDFNALKYAATKVDGIISRGPMIQGAFLESMGMGMRKEILKNAHKDKSDYKKVWDILDRDYLRLVHPDQMGEIYKFLFLGNKHIGELYPFLEETLNQPAEYS